MTSCNLSGSIDMHFVNMCISNWKHSIKAPLYILQYENNMTDAYMKCSFYIFVYIK